MLFTFAVLRMLRGRSCYLCLKQIGAFGYFGIGHGISAKRAFFCLNADIGHGFVGGTLDIAVAVGGYTHYRAFGNVEHRVVDLKTAFAREDYVVFFVCLVAVEEGNAAPGGKRAERYFARACAGRFFDKQFAFESMETADRGMGEFFALIEDSHFVHIENIY